MKRKISGIYFYLLFLSYSLVAMHGTETMRSQAMIPCSGYQQRSDYSQQSIPMVQLSSAPINITISNSSDNDIAQQQRVRQNLESKVQQEVEMVNMQQQRLNLVQETTMLNEQFQEQRVEQPSNQASMESFLSSHKWKFFLGFLSVVYMQLYRKCVEDTAFIKNPHIWANWQPYFPDKGLEENLLHAIQIRYFNPEKPYNYKQPLVYFSRALDYEKKRFNNFLYYVSWFKRLKIGSLFPINTYMVDYVKVCKKRIEALQKFFLQCSAERNILAAREKARSSSSS